VRVFDIQSKVEGFSPHTLSVSEFDIKSILFANFLWVSLWCSMPKSLAIGFFIFHRHTSNLRLECGPKCKILDDFNGENLSTFWFFSFELYVSIFPKLTLVIKLFHLIVCLRTVLFKWIYPLIWIFSCKKIFKLIAHPIRDFLLLQPILIFYC
jgi:hypothetical protein